MATTATPRFWYSAASDAKPARTCFTNGQWLQMKATRSAGEPSKPASDHARPEGSASSNEGAFAPSGSIIVDAVWAMRPLLSVWRRGQRARAGA